MDERNYLPGSIRERLQDLMKEYKVTQSELAARIGSTDSALSRFISGKTDKISEEHIIRMAKAFSVSTDFLLGVTDIPDRKNYEISELGLSVQAARNLYTGKVSADVVNRLLESPRFAEVTYMIEQYFNDTLASGFAAQNQMYTTLSSLLRKTVKTDAAVQAAREVNRLKVSVYQADLTTIQNQFMASLKEVKKEMESDFTAIQKISQAATNEMFEKLTKGQNIQHPSISAEQVTDAITSAIAGTGSVSEGTLEKFNQVLLELMQDMAQPPQEKDNADNEQ